MTTFLIVDDHGAFRQQAGALLQSEGLTVIGEAADGIGALAAVRDLRPDVVILDVGLPDLDGFAVADRLADLVPRPHVVLISSRDAETYGLRLSAATSIGFIQKDDLSAAALRVLIQAASKPSAPTEAS